MRDALYVERDGAGREGDLVQVFDRELDQAEGAAFVERCEADRHHFRVIVSPEYGGAIDDLKTYTRDLHHACGGEIALGALPEDGVRTSRLVCSGSTAWRHGASPNR